MVHPMTYQPNPFLVYDAACITEATVLDPIRNTVYAIMNRSGDYTVTLPESGSLPESLTLIFADADEEGTGTVTIALAEGDITTEPLPLTINSEQQSFGLVADGRDSWTFLQT